MHATTRILFIELLGGLGDVLIDLPAIQALAATFFQAQMFHDVPCRICYKRVCPEGHQHCLSLLKQQTVVEAVLELLPTSLTSNRAIAIA